MSTRDDIIRILKDPSLVTVTALTQYVEAQRADALSRFSITEFPNGKIQTLIADGTHWVTVSTANSMVDRARADEREQVALDTAAGIVDPGLRAVIVDEALADLRAKAGELTLWEVGGIELLSRTDVLAMVEERFSGWLSPEEVARQMELVRADEKVRLTQRVVAEGCTCCGCDHLIALLNS